MKFITVTESQRTLLKALYEQRGMRYIVHDRLGDAAVYTKLPVFNETNHLWSIPDMQLSDVDYLSQETIHDLAAALRIELTSNPLPMFWLAPEDGIVPISALLDLSEANGVTTMEQVKKEG